MSYSAPPTSRLHLELALARSQNYGLYYGRLLDGFIASRGIEDIGDIDDMLIDEYADAATNDEPTYDPEQWLEYDGSVRWWITDSLVPLGEPEFTMATPVKQYESVLYVRQQWLSWQIALVLQVERWISFGEHGGRPQH